MVRMQNAEFGVRNGKLERQMQDAGCFEFGLRIAECGFLITVYDPSKRPDKWTEHYRKRR